MINDGPFYELLPVSISILSADFYRMGGMAAQFIMKGTTGSEKVPTRLTVRDSL
jgi:DNA-binding LacI/PurR family transcriptional regulator